MGWGPDGYLRPVQFLDHLTVITKLAWKEAEEQLCILIARLALETRSFPLPEPKTEAVKIIWGLRTANSAFIALVFD